MLNLNKHCTLQHVFISSLGSTLNQNDLTKKTPKRPNKQKTPPETKNTNVPNTQKKPIPKQWKKP